MFKESCPGSREIRSPFPEEIICPHCKSRCEMWSDETDTVCKSCNKPFDRSMKASCLLWCPAAKECVGAEKYERLKKAMKEEK